MSEQSAYENNALGEMVAKLTNDQAELLRKRARKATALIVAGIIWSFLYTAISLFVMFGMSSQTHETCEQFAESRETVRALILTDPDFDEIDTDKVSEVLPPIEC